MNTPTLETQRLILRKFTENDYEALFLIPGTIASEKFFCFFRMCQLNFDENENFVYKKYWEMNQNYFIEETQ